MKKRELLERLMGEISGEEWEQLEDPSKELCISAYNRRTLLEMRTCVCAGDVPSAEKTELLRRTLEAYLNQYMGDHPEGHKWIILCCLYLTFIEEKPMHPQEIVKYRIERTKQGIRYVCPCRTMEEGSVCAFCAAKSESP